MLNNYLLISELNLDRKLSFVKLQQYTNKGMENEKHKMGQIFTSMSSLQRLWPKCEMLYL